MLEHLAVVDCGPLAAPMNGSIIISETTFGSISTFMCNEGFNQSGSSIRQCEANGNWSGIDTVCTSKEMVICKLNFILFLVHHVLKLSLLSISL